LGALINQLLSKIDINQNDEKIVNLSSNDCSEHHVLASYNLMKSEHLLISARNLSENKNGKRNCSSYNGAKGLRMLNKNDGKAILIELLLL
jgi:hypothetical protein